jgi:ketosteroid isomerase-like protein
MSDHNESRREFLAVGAGAVASTSLAGDASAQSGLEINKPSVVQEVEAAFAAYYRALAQNDVAALNALFYDSPVTVRYGNAENLYGYAEIKAYRAAVTAPTEPKHERTVITTFGSDFATASTLNRRSSGKIGRTMQTWVRFPQGWRIVAAHVSTIDEPNK